MKKLIGGLLIIVHICAIGQDSTEAQQERNQKWQQDFAQLVKLIETEHLNYGHTINEEAWKEKVYEIYEAIPTMTNLEVIGAFMELMAKIGDGHTVLYPPMEGQYGFTALPLEFYFFEEDLYIRGAETSYASLVGCKVLKVGAMDIQQVIDASIPYIARDNQMQVKWILPIALGFADIYQLIGAVQDRDTIDFVLETPDGELKNTVLKSGILTKDPMSRFVPEQWTDMRKGQNLLWTKDPDNYYWYEYLEAQKVVYFQFNQVRNKDEQDLKTFCKELMNFINSEEVTALIIDIRLNNGGNNVLNKHLVEPLSKNEKINKKGHLFTIIGRRTFSAAMNLSSDLENNTQTLFVGEPTGSRPNFYGEDNLFVLSNSKLSGSISNRYWQGGKSADDNRPWIAPDIPAELTAMQYMRNQDPALEAIFEYLGLNR